MAVTGADLIVVVNKWWEAAPLVGVFQHADASPAELVDVGRTMGSGASGQVPRLTLNCKGMRVAVWCIQDWMNPDESPSLTLEKVRFLERLKASGGTPQAIIAMGTAAFPSKDSRNGCVVVTGKYFIHDPFRNARPEEKRWTPLTADTVIESRLNDSLKSLVATVRNSVNTRLIQPPLSPASPPEMICEKVGCNLSDVNVVDPSLYAEADGATLEAFAQAAPDAIAISMETTLGVICQILDAPFAIVSGIANRVGAFPTEVGPRPYAQNFVAAHNAAIAVAWLMPAIAETL
jgi:hypothetical protein